MSKQKVNISFKIEEEIKADFEKVCKEKHSTISHELYGFVHRTVKAIKEGNQTLKKLRNE